MPYIFISFHILILFFRFLLDLKSKVNGTLTIRPLGFNGKDVKALVKVVDDEIAETDYVTAEQGKYE